ncbi:hypothetical protein C900_01510 [Fulvivirga imtechensis AK7]|uniref:Uncharacterized protein n=1 Tax=Fulvivirga imtechensis AK7 TaxID=1237149 RepID=L8JKD5_9BACT|nr:hypothetical protein C900_01510 [Fulvivirga imtechensis AK7]
MVDIAHEKKFKIIFPFIYEPKVLYQTHFTKLYVAFLFLF